jgi:hypothetical protein
MKDVARLTEAARQLTPNLNTDKPSMINGAAPVRELSPHRLLEMGLRNSDPAYRYCCPDGGPWVFC